MDVRNDWVEPGADDASSNMYDDGFVKENIELPLNAWLALCPKFVVAAGAVEEESDRLAEDSDPDAEFESLSVFPSL